MPPRKRLPRPSPLLAPSTRPPMSTTCTAAWTTLRLLDIATRRSRRSSGTLATPMLGSFVAKGYGAARAPPPVRALYSELLPAFGSPTRPKRSIRRATLPPAVATVPGRALGAVALAVRRPLRPRPGRRGRRRRRAVGLGRRVRLGPPLEPHVGAVRRPVGDARRRRRRDRAGAHRHDGHRPAAPATATRRPGGDVT